MLHSRGLLRPLAHAWAGGPSGGQAAWAALAPLRPLSSTAGAGSTESEIVVEQHHQEEVAEEEAEEWALGQREHHEHEGFEALPWPPVADPPSNSNSWHNGGNSSSAGPVRFYSAASGQAGGGGTAGGGAAAGGKKEADRPAWERAEVLWEAEEPQPSSGRPGGEERDPFQGEEVNPHSQDRMSQSAREKMLSDEAERLANESGP